MKPNLILLAGLLVTLDLQAQRAAIPFDSGSNGSLGDLVVSNAVLIPLPPDGVLHYKRFEVAAGGSVLFGKNALNTPVTLLAQGDVISAGDITLDGTPPSGPDPGRGGPGGFDGGRGNSGTQPAGPGKGPGGGLPACCFAAGPGAFADRGDAGPDRNASAGEAYGDPLLLPLVGGSGGGGLQNAFVGGGGGGGVVVVPQPVFGMPALTQLANASMLALASAIAGAGGMRVTPVARRRVTAVCARLLPGAEVLAAARSA